VIVLETQHLKHGVHLYCSGRVCRFRRETVDQPPVTVVTYDLELLAHKAFRTVGS
jgi:hypothetical protein